MLVARLRLLSFRAAARNLGIIDLELQQQTMRVDSDAVAFLYKSDRAADIGFRRDVANDHAPCTAGKAAIRD